MLQDTGKTDFSRMSDHIVLAFNSSFDDDGDGVRIPDEPMPPLCEGIPRRLWVGKYVVLYKNDEVPVAKGICRNVSSDVVIGTTGPLGDSHVAVQISSSLSMADVPDEWRYSIEHGLWSSSSTMVLASGTMKYEQNTTPELPCFPPDL